MKENVSYSVLRSGESSTVLTVSDLSPVELGQFLSLITRVSEQRHGQPVAPMPTANFTASLIANHERSAR